MRKLTILVSSVNAVGHVNACSGALSGLLARGHRVIFVLEKAFKGKLKALGYEEHIWVNAPPTKEALPEKSAENEGDLKKNPGERMAHFMLQNKIIGPFTPLEKMENIFKFFENETNQAEFKLCNAAVSEAIALYKPDAIYVDGSLLPCIYYSGISWIKQVSTTPLFFQNDPELPPGGSGLPTNDRSEWHLWDNYRKEMEFSPKYGDLLEKMGYERYPNDQVMPQTQILTVYAYPDELNYERVKQKGWFNLQVFNKRETNKLGKLSDVVPESFLADTLDGKFSGRKIYVALGSMSSVDLEFMTRLLAVLAKTPHKYIVSKGPRHLEYSLASNMWGDRYLNQMQIIPHVDLVITHGGNNTVTETFAEGKPMIVFPSFADQFDNATRLTETGFGIKVEPYNFSEKQLIDAIEKLLNDASLKARLASASQRILASNRREELASAIEQLLVVN